VPLAYTFKVLEMHHRTVKQLANEKPAEVIIFYLREAGQLVFSRDWPYMINGSST